VQRDNVDDALPHHLRVRTNTLGGANQLLGNRALDTGQMNADVGRQRVQPVHRVASERHGDIDRGVDKRNVVFSGNQCQCPMKTGRVSRRKQLFGIGAAAWAAQRFRQSQVEFKVAVVRTPDALP
jgi:hypothetical protein